MYDFKETGDERILNEVMTKMSKFINAVAWKKSTQSPTGLHTKDDLESIAKATIWRAIGKFNFYCPHCSLISLSEKGYRKHCKNAHGVKYLIPKVTIVKFVKYQIGTYLQNAIKTEYSIKNKSNVLTIPIFRPGFEDNTKSENEVKYFNLDKLYESTDFVNDEIFKQLLELSSKNLDEFSNEILQCLIQNMSQREIANMLYDKGKYSSIESAAVMVSRTIKNKIAKNLLWLIEENNFSFA